MRIDIITLFPKYVESLFAESIVKRAVEEKRIEIVTHNLRDWSEDSYGTVDGRPYGGGPGMVLRVDVMDRAITAVKEIINSDHPVKIILLTPQGQVYKQIIAYKLAKETNLILICGHYEGFDERIRGLVDQEISIGDYVLTGGELAAGVMVDSIVRLLPGVLGHDDSPVEESHAEGLLEYPQYTRPEDYEGKKVPEILLSGDHARIAKWRRQESIKRTSERRPDLA